MDEALARRAGAQENVNHFAEKCRRARDDKMKALYLEEWRFEQRMFDHHRAWALGIWHPHYRAKNPS